jgi:branched-chain amino acid transport system substrate-binding protein
MFRRTIISTMAGLMLASLSAHAQLTDDVVKIGVLTDMAGVTADITGKGSVVAAQLAVEEFGSTILGKPIEVISADHQHKTPTRWMSLSIYPIPPLRLPSSASHATARSS